MSKKIQTIFPPHPYNIQANVPTENIMAMYEELAQYS